MTSASVLGNPMLMSDMRRMLRAYGENGPRHSASSTPDTSDVARIRRDLFGPVDHEETQRFVDNELVAQQTRDADRWGFDFGRESPRKSGPGTARYSWEKVAPTEPVPEPYALRRLPYLQQAAVVVSADQPGEDKRRAEDEAAKVAGETVAKETTKQSHITDYMKGRKRAFSATTSAKPQTPAPPPPRPSKQARSTPS